MFSVSFAPSVCELQLDFSLQCFCWICVCPQTVKFKSSLSAANVLAPVCSSVLWLWKSCHRNKNTANVNFNSVFFVFFLWISHSAVFMSWWLHEIIWNLTKSWKKTNFLLCENVNVVFYLYKFLFLRMNLCWCFANNLFVFYSFIFFLCTQNQTDTWLNEKKLTHNRSLNMKTEQKMPLNTFLKDILKR